MSYKTKEKIIFNKVSTRKFKKFQQRVEDQRIKHYHRFWQMASLIDTSVLQTCPFCRTQCLFWLQPFKLFMNNIKIHSFRLGYQIVSGSKGKHESTCRHLRSLQSGPLKEVMLQSQLKPSHCCKHTPWLEHESSWQVVLGPEKQSKRNLGSLKKSKNVLHRSKVTDSSCQHLKLHDQTSLESSSSHTCIRNREVVI